MCESNVRNVAITQSQHILPLVRRKRLLSAADVRAHGWSPQLLVELQQSGKLMRVGG